MKAWQSLRMGHLSRRQVLNAFGGAALLVGCGDDELGTGAGGSGAGGSGAGTGGPGTGGGTTGGLGGMGQGGAGGMGQGGAGGGNPLADCKMRGPTDGCYITEDNILGPFYKAGAPFENDLADGLDGDLMLIQGTVFGCDCVTPLAGAIVDVWQADAEGAYDNEGFILRGKIETDEDGKYSFVTVKPGWYLNGAQYRPAHIHYIPTSRSIPS
jgi:hypothetical protein